MSESGSTTGWQEGLVQRVDRLQRRSIVGRFVVSPDPAVEVVAAERYLDDSYLEQALARAAGSNPASEAGGTSPAAMEYYAGVSRFVRHYAGSLSIAALVGLAEGVGLDVSPPRCTLIIYNNVPFRLMLDLPGADVLRCEERPTSLPAEGRVLESVTELRAQVWQKLYGEHLGPLITRVVEATGISAALLWTNAAECFVSISEAAREYLDEQSAQPFVADRRAVFRADRLSCLDEDMNPVRLDSSRRRFIPVRGCDKTPVLSHLHTGRPLRTTVRELSAASTGRAGRVDPRTARPTGGSACWRGREASDRARHAATADTASPTG